jgi:hypothetical protein
MGRVSMRTTVAVLLLVTGLSGCAKIAVLTSPGTSSNAYPVGSVTTGHWWLFTSSAPPVAWTSPSAPDAASRIVQYEVSVSTTAGGSDVLAWKSAGTSLKLASTNGVTLIAGNTYFTNVRILYKDGQYSEIVSSKAWQARTTANAFESRLDLTALAKPRDVAAADLNGDGYLDIVSANGGPGGTTISIFPGNGDGTFLARTDLTVGDNPQTLSIADFNKDGFLDIGVLSYTAPGLLQVFHGNGDGTFAARRDLTLGEGVMSLVANDFDKDGRMDLAVGVGQSIDTLLFLKNDPVQAWEFAAGASQSFAVNNAKATISADFNKDGNPDIATVAEMTNELRVFLGNGAGAFSALPAVTTPQTPRGIATGDFNGDGILDIATGNFDANSVSVFFGNGSGGFALAATYAVTGNPHGLQAVDVNGDGVLDILAACNLASGAGANTLGLLLGNGDGTFQSKLEFATGSQPMRLSVADLNRDGLPDIMVANGGAGAGMSTVNVFLGR